jgi:hypothetical protein
MVELMTEFIFCELSRCVSSMIGPGHHGIEDGTLPDDGDVACVCWISAVGEDYFTTRTMQLLGIELIRLAAL